MRDSISHFLLVNPKFIFQENIGFKMKHLKKQTQRLDYLGLQKNQAFILSLQAF